MDFRFRGNGDSSVNAVIPAQAGMTTRYSVAPKAITVIPAQAGMTTRYSVAPKATTVIPAQAGIHEP